MGWVNLTTFDGQSATQRQRKEKRHLCGFRTMYERLKKPLESFLLEVLHKCPHMEGISLSWTASTVAWTHCVRTRRW